MERRKHPRPTAFNISDLSTAPYSPFFLMHGFNPNLKIDRKLLGNTSEKELKKMMKQLPDLSQYVARRQPMMKLVLATLAMARSEEREKYLADTNVHRAGAEKYEPGDMCTVAKSPGHGRNTCECWSQRRMIPRREPECRHVSGKVIRA